MAIGMVELQGGIPRVQDFQQFQHNENENVLIYQDNQQRSMEEKVDTDNHSVHEKEDADKSSDSEDNNNTYGGDGGRNRHKKASKPADRIIEKNKMSFDVKI